MQSSLFGHLLVIIVSSNLSCQMEFEGGLHGFAVAENVGLFGHLASLDG